VTQPLYIGIDLGTSGCRAMAIDSDGRLQAQADTALPEPVRDGCRAEQAPELWWQGVRDTLVALLAQIPAGSVRALAVDGTSGTLLLADAGGNPLGPALMYNDGRSQTEAQRIAEFAPKESAAHGASSALAKLLHLNPGAETAYALHQADWIIGKLSDCFGVSDENNCLKLGFDAIHKCWPDWLDNLGVKRELLPRVLFPGTPLGTITAELAHEFGLPAETLVVAGTTDSTAAFMATGAGEIGEAVTSLGSTLVMKVIADRPIFSPAHGVYSQPLGERWLVGGGSNSGGAVLLHYFNREQLAEMTPQLKPAQPTGLDYYPLLTPGERFPVADSGLAPRLSPQPDDDVVFFQAMLEGMARIELRGYQLLAELGAPYPVSIRSAGGGSRNPAWNVIRQNMLGVPLLEAEQQEAAYGSALLARKGYLENTKAI
jgi:sugar (pentulose or hexulose) kinase